MDFFSNDDLIDDNVDLNEAVLFEGDYADADAFLDYGENEYGEYINSTTTSDNLTNYPGPKPSDWVDVDTSVCPPTITIDKARRELWKQGKRELKMVTDKMIRRWENSAEFSANPSVKKVPSDFVFKKIFGIEDSAFGQYFTRKLGLSTADYYRFLGTFWMSCQWGVPVKNLHSSKHFQSQFTMETNEYNDI
jgi:hypothetical protein